MEMSQNKNYMIIMKPNTTTYSIEELTSVPKYEKLKAALDGGMLEVVPYFHKFMERNCVAFCDEEGKLHGLPFNMMAHIYWEHSYGKPIRVDHLVGPIVIIVGSQEFLSQL